MPNPSSANISSPTAMAALTSSTNAYQTGRNKQISKPILGSLIHTGFFSHFYLIDNFLAFKGTETSTKTNAGEMSIALMKSI